MVIRSLLVSLHTDCHASLAMTDQFMDYFLDTDSVSSAGQAFVGMVSHYVFDIIKLEGVVMDTNTGKMLIVIGVFLVVLGLVFTFWQRIPLLGRLPGDFSFKWGNTRFYFPLMTSIILSLLLTLILNIISRLFKK